MPLNENDLSFIMDIVDCIIDINEFTNGIQFYEFEKEDLPTIWWKGKGLNSPDETESQF